MKKRKVSRGYEFRTAFSYPRWNFRCLEDDDVLEDRFCRFVNLNFRLKRGVAWDWVVANQPILEWNRDEVAKALWLLRKRIRDFRNLPASEVA